MKQSVNFSAFVDAFHAHNRYDSFGYDGLRVIFDFFEQYEEDTGEEIELDVIAICCDYTLDTVSDIIDNYSIDVSDLGDNPDSGELCAYVTEWLNDRTFVLGSPNDCEIVYQCF
jgi:hypothetical protein